MKTPCGFIIEVKNQIADMRRQNETRPPHDLKPGIHPLGGVLLRLELAIALICQTKARLRR